MNKALALSMLCAVAITGTQSASAILPPLPASAFGPTAILSALPGAHRAAQVFTTAAGVVVPLVHRTAVRHLQPAFDVLVAEGAAQVKAVAGCLQRQTNRVVAGLSEKASQEVTGLGERAGDLLEQVLVNVGLVEPKNPWEKYLIPAGVGAAGITTGIATVLLYQYLRSAKKSNKAIEASGNAQAA